VAFAGKEKPSSLKHENAITLYITDWQFYF